MDEDEESLEFLSRPIKAVEEKWKLLPHFLRMRGLMRQHIDSFDHFINLEIKKIVAARSNCEVRSEADPKFFLRYTDIYVGEPNIEEESFVTTNGWPILLTRHSLTLSVFPQ
jgi:DNA-directed RNA polymerase III subunit RPC2